MISNREFGEASAITLAALTLLTTLIATPAEAGLGEPEHSIARDRERHQARSQQIAGNGYDVHKLQMADGTRINEYVGPDKRVFAVSWNALHKPDLSLLLGNSYATYDAQARIAGAGKGLVRSYHHRSEDLVVQMSGHLHVYNGYAYHPSLLPAGFNESRLGQE